MANDQESSFVNCSFCSHTNSAKAKFCSYCGGTLAVHQSSKEISNGKKEDFLFSEAFCAKFEIIEKIGEGGMSIVYKATQKNIQKTIAIKILKTSLLHDKEAIRRFHEEARNAGSMKHPNIISIYDEGEIDNIHFIAMEYLYGADFHTYIYQNGPFNENQFKEIFIQLADAVQYLENHNLTHRDVKSSNIFITKEGKPVLMDFGIASQGILMQTSLYETNYGTPEYMSPEQINGSSVDSRSDLFSLGVVMYEALTGELPFKGAVYADTLNMILHDEPNLNFIRDRGISFQLEYLIQKLLQKDPLERFQHASDIAAHLSAKSFKSPKNIIKITTIDKLLKGAVYFLAAFIFIIAIVALKPWDLYKSGSNSNDKTTPSTVKPHPVKIEKKEPVSKENENIQIHQGAPELGKVPAMDTPINQKPQKVSHKTKAEIAEDYGNQGRKYLDEGNDLKAKESFRNAMKFDSENETYKLLLNEADQRLQKQKDNQK